VAGARNYLGLACSGHDDAVALVDERGEVVFAEAVERPLQRKRALHAPPDDISRLRRLIAERCPQDAEIVLAKTWSDGAVAHLGELEREAAAQARVVARLDPSGHGAAELHAYRHLLRVGAAHIALAGSTAEAYLQQERGQAQVRVRAYDHHLTHAAAGCLIGPFAPATLHEHGERWFIDYRDAPYMERALRFRAEVRDRVPAVVHADGTGRLQSVTARRNPRFHALLTAFFERTGVPLLLNTSLNVMGKPIAHSVEDAVALFATSGLDALFIEDLVVLKRET